MPKLAEDSDLFQVCFQITAVETGFIYVCLQLLEI